MRRSSKIDMSKGPWASYRGSMASRCAEFMEDYCLLPESRELMVLAEYQKALVEEWADGGTKAHLTCIAAGNAKTTTLGAFLTAHLYLTEEASVPVVASTVTQAVLTAWGRVKRFIELCPDLENRAEILEGQGSRRGIYVPSTNGHCFPIADKPSGLQGLNPSIAVLEETSEADMDTFGALMNRLGKRAEGKLIGISTPSFLEDNALLTVQRAARGGEALPGVVLNEYISDQTDHRDEEMWALANPALAAGILDIGAIRTDLALLPEQSFRAYRLCQNPKGSESCWLNATDEKGEELGDAYDIWQRGESAFKLKEGQVTWVGVDVAKSRDHAAVVWGQYRDDGRLHTLCKVWTPTSTADIDLEDIADHLRWLCGKFAVEAIWFDPAYFYNAPQLDNEGLPMVSISQTEARMAPLVGHAYQSIRRSRITHDGDEQFTKHVLAGKRRYGPAGFTIEKRTFSNKCDAAIALVLCHGAANGIEEAYGLDSFKIF